MKSYLLLLVLLVSGCANVSVADRSSMRDSVVVVRTKNGSLETDIYRVRSWCTFSYPWELKVGEHPPSKLFLSPGKYTFELLCNGGGICLHWMPEVVVRVKSGTSYILGCIPIDGGERFSFEEMK